jgi:hypothetical protein
MGVYCINYFSFISGLLEKSTFAFPRLIQVRAIVLKTDLLIVITNKWLRKK